jgi:hypothetical protein
MHTTEKNDNERRRAAREQIRDARLSAAVVLDARREPLREALARRTRELTNEANRAA